jgi:hypothetical protein
MTQTHLNLLHSEKIQMLIETFDLVPKSEPLTDLEKFEAKKNAEIKAGVSRRVQGWMKEFEAPPFQPKPDVDLTSNHSNAYITHMRALHGNNWTPF